MRILLLSIMLAAASFMAMPSAVADHCGPQDPCPDDCDDTAPEDIDCRSCHIDPARCGGMCYQGSYCCEQGWEECNCDEGAPSCDWEGPCEPGDTEGGDGYTCVCDPVSGQCRWNDNCPRHNPDGSCMTGDPEPPEECWLIGTERAVRHPGPCIDSITGL